MKKKILSWEDEYGITRNYDDTTCTICRMPCRSNGNGIRGLTDKNDCIEKGRYHKPLKEDKILLDKEVTVVDEFEITSANLCPDGKVHVDGKILKRHKERLDK